MYSFFVCTVGPTGYLIWSPVIIGDPLQCPLSIGGARYYAGEIAGHRWDNSNQ